MKNQLDKSVKKTALLLIGSFFLRTNSVMNITGNLRRSIIFYISTTIFLIAAIFVIFFEIYQMMLASGFSYLFSLNFMVCILILSSLICLSFARYFARKASNERKSQECSLNKNSLEKIAQSFLEGFFEGKT